MVTEPCRFGASWRLDRAGHCLDIQLTRTATTAALLDCIAQSLAYLSRIHYIRNLQSIALVVGSFNGMLAETTAKIKKG